MRWCGGAPPAHRVEQPSPSLLTHSIFLIGLSHGHTWCAKQRGLAESAAAFIPKRSARGSLCCHTTMDGRIMAVFFLFFHLSTFLNNKWINHGHIRVGGIALHYTVPCEITYSPWTFSDLSRLQPQILSYSVSVSLCYSPCREICFAAR